MGTTVTRFIRDDLKYPKDYPKLSKLATSIWIEDETELSPLEDGTPNVVGTAVDYITRYMLTGRFREAFRTAFIALLEVKNEYEKEEYENRVDEDDYIDFEEGIPETVWEDPFLNFYAQHGERLYEAFTDYWLNKNPKALLRSDKFIRTCIELSANPEQIFRAGRLIWEDYDPSDISKATINNVRIMVKRSLKYLKQYKNIEAGGNISLISPVITHGDWDYLGDGCLIDFKVSKYPANERRNWLQLMTYFLLTKRKIHTLKIFNPRLNVEHTLHIKDIPEECFILIKDVAKIETSV